MYLRTIKRTNKDGSVFRYLQIAHNVWDPVKKSSVAKVQYSFGREDQLDPDALAGLAVSIKRYLGVREDEDWRPGRVDARSKQWRPVASRPAGGGWLLDGIWRQLEIDKTIRRLLKGRRLDASA